jgi:hypothetical protein
MMNFAKPDQPCASDSIEPREVFVGIFDVLGFEDLVSTKPLSFIAGEYGDLRRMTDWSSIVPVLGPSGRQNWISPFVVVSDTILIWSEDDPLYTDAFLSSCAELVARSFEKGWELRGAITFGECILHRPSQTYLGKPIVSAYKLAKAQDWIGVALDQSCFSAPKSGGKLKDGGNILWYPIPLKPDSDKMIEIPTWALVWTDRIHSCSEMIRERAEKQKTEHQQRYWATYRFALACKERLAT